MNNKDSLDVLDLEDMDDIQSVDQQYKSLQINKYQAGNLINIINNTTVDCGNNDSSIDILDQLIESKMNKMIDARLKKEVESIVKSLAIKMKQFES